jgi:hypothetical protein
VAEPLIIAPPGWPALPKQTIAPDVALWCARYLTFPDGPDAGQPWRFTNQQLRILAYWFAYDDRRRWLYRRGTVRMCKGWGKDPFAGVLSAVELAGPCRVGPDGHGVQYPAPWIQVAAVAKDQTRNTMRVFPGLFNERAIEEFGIEVNKEIIYARGGRAVIEAVTSSPSALEGGRTTLVIRNEIQEWRQSNQGHDMAEVIDGNLAKSRDGAARALSLCNAHVPGEDTVGEREWDAYQAIAQGRTRVKDVFYYAVEADPTTELTDADSLKAGLLSARGDATWLDPERLANEVWDPRTTPSEARRKYLNQIVAAEDAFFDPQKWRACELSDAKLEPRELITLGFDGSKTEDHTGLVATRIKDGVSFVLGHWDPATLGGQIDRVRVDAAVANAFETYDVVGFYSDLHPFESYVDMWANEFGRDQRKGLLVHANTKHPIAWDMRGRSNEFTVAAERVAAEVEDGILKYGPSPALIEHGLNARRRPNRIGVTFGKETRESTRRVDLLAAMTLSRLARSDYLALPEVKRKRRERAGQGGAGFF